MPNSAMIHHSLQSLLATAMLLFLGMHELIAATFTVTSTNDAGPGTLRQAINDANTNSGLDIIQFSLTPNTRTISPSASLPTITDPIIIDGSSQPGFSDTPLIELNGQLAGSAVTGLRITAGSSSVRSLIINRFTSHGVEIADKGTNLLEGNIIVLDPSGSLARANIVNGILITNAANNIVGGTSSSSRNVISGNGLNGVYIGGSNAFGNQVLNNFIGLSTSGLNKVGNGQNGVFINSSPSNQIGNASGGGNIISGNQGSGINIVILGGGVTAIGNRVSGNYIGLDVTGQKAISNSLHGIFIGHVSQTVIGGTSPAERNVISGNARDGVILDSGVSGGSFPTVNNYIQGNFIGTAADGVTPIGNGSNGVTISSFAFDNQIGGAGAGAGNRILSNGGRGVHVFSTANNLIRGNIISGNAQLGIDLGAEGVTPNDVNDTDTGANMQQNFPLLTAITNSIAGTQVWGTLDSRPGSTYTIDVYLNKKCDESGYGEGQVYVGSTALTTDSSGHASFSLFSDIVDLPARFFTAIATDSQNNTSEFGPCTVAVSTLPPIIYTVTTVNDFGPGSLRQAILDANQNINAGDRIHFNIPGPGPHTIALTSTLPAVSDTTHIDGYTQPGAAPNTLSNGFNAEIRIRVDGQNVFGSLSLSAVGASIRGLAFIRCSGAGLGLTPEASACQIHGNIMGMDVNGVAAGNRGPGIYGFNSPGHLIGGTRPADRNIIGANGGHGIEFDGTNSYGIVAQGNFIGTDPSGTSARGNNGCGFYYSSTHDSVIGGTQPGAGNLISRNNVHGVELTRGASRITVQGNIIGTDRSGMFPLGNGYDGVSMSTEVFFEDPRPVGHVVGGIVPGAGNRIAFNGRDGVYVGGGTYHSVRGNAIYSNSWFGIDLDPAGVVLPNDPGDTDTGANDRQNYPVLVSATNEFGIGRIQGTLNSRPNRSYDLDLFSNYTCGQSAGQTYLGSVTVTTDAGGNGSFVAMLRLKNPDERWITASATDSFGNTSEFSPCGEMFPGRPQLRVSASDGNVLVQWPSAVSADFIVETTTNLGLNAWQPAEGTVVDDGTVKTYSIVPNPDEPTRFFRLRK